MSRECWSGQKINKWELAEKSWEFHRTRGFGNGSRLQYTMDRNIFVENDRDIKEIRVVSETIGKKQKFNIP